MNIDARFNSLSDQFTREYDAKGYTVQKEYQQIKDTYIYGDAFPSVSIINKQQVAVNRTLNDIDSRINKDYSVDHRIIELERVAEADYQRRKQIIAHLEEEKVRQQKYYETLQRIREQKDMLDQTTRYDNYEQDTFDYGQNPFNDNKNILIADQNQPAGPKSQSVGIRPTTNNIASLVDKFQSNQMWNLERLQSSQVGNNNVSKLQSSQVSNMGTNIRGSLNKNDDFNINQMRRSQSNDGKIREFEYSIRDKGNKFQQIGKHYQTWRPKRLQQIEVEPEITHNRAQDEMIRKVLIKVKSLLQAKRLKEAEAVVVNAITEGYNHSDIYYMAGEVKRALGLLPEAVQNFLTALKYEVHSPYIYQSLGMCYIDLGDDAKAIPLLKHFVEKIESESGNYELGNALARGKNYLGASVHLSKAIELNNKQPEYYLNRAEVYEALGFMKLATDDYRAYRNLNPNYQYKFELEAKHREEYGKFVEADRIRNFAKKITSS